jgi:hypothetical protein
MCAKCFEMHGISRTQDLVQMVTNGRMVVQHFFEQLSQHNTFSGYKAPQLPMGTPPKSNVEAVNQVLQERHQILLKLKEQLHKAQDRMKKLADIKRTERQFKVGD